MRASTFVLVAIICSGVIAVDINCTEFNTNLTCIDPACQFTPNGNDYSCNSKCVTLTGNKDDCNKNNVCEFKDAFCSTDITTCDKIQGDITQATCSAQNNACTFTPGKAATCGVTTTISDACAANNDNQPGCSKNTNCLFTEKDQICNFNQDAATCNTNSCSPNYCDSTTACQANSADTCTAFLNADDCAKNDACSWNNTTCVDACPGKNQDECTAATDCSFKITTCTVNANKGATFCSANKSDNDCSGVQPANICQIASTGTCGVTDTITTACQNVAVCDPNTCTKVDEVKATCVNPTCSQDIKNCGNGCKATEAVCDAKDKDACGKNTTQGDCNATATFCQYIQNGKCAAKDSGSSNAALLTFAFLSTLLALLF